jgi:hypothetical protein
MPLLGSSQLCMQHLDLLLEGSCLCTLCLQLLAQQLLGHLHLQQQQQHTKHDTMAVQYGMNLLIPSMHSSPMTTTWSK